MPEEIQQKLPGEITADALLAEIESNNLEPLCFTEMLDALPSCLKGALGIVLEGFDYEAEKSTDRAIVARIIALLIVNIKPFTRPNEKEDAA